MIQPYDMNSYTKKKITIEDKAMTPRCHQNVLLHNGFGPAEVDQFKYPIATYLVWLTINEVYVKQKV